jgi:hypothetical protein
MRRDGGEGRRFRERSLPFTWVSVLIEEEVGEGMKEAKGARQWRFRWISARWRMN